ncbi:hypothetical protein [Deinococcus sp. QL22]|uniref:hypothetical protein n=1 Tax=Deinococcus sp. QL22 TaxID=2939437 RepID=UPI0020173B4E|nr:hypothetical protein [Deinococcus sp. QL22]UQN08425.1 hypothetical protein M1R55_17025 [Deinococcus sp. QL22]
MAENYVQSIAVGILIFLGQRTDPVLEIYSMAEVMLKVVKASPAPVQTRGDITLVDAALARQTVQQLDARHRKTGL